MKSCISIIILAVMAYSSAAFAQHEVHTHEGHDMHEMNKMASTETDTLSAMSHAFSLNLPMNRNGSGTGWLTDSSPMYGYMLHSKKWMYMFHGNLFLRYNHQDITNKGTRGDRQFDAPNWVMAMGQRRVGKRGLFRFSTMFSLDELFAGGRGYPLLFQSGETYQGRRLVDRQHPHEFISELSVGYTHMISNDIDVFGYVGYPGEPALGPVAFMHRVSSLNLPDSPLGHHWQDATHIVFGVATLGLRYKIFKLDGSVFTGREPDENRYNFDRPRFDSYSYRLTANPNANLSIQASHAFIKSAEVLTPDENVRRTSASVIYNLPLGPENFNFATSAVWGYNNSGHGHQEHSFTLEPNLQLDRFALYGRYEWVQKSSEELELQQFNEHALFNINAFTLGVSYTIFREFNTNLSLGAHGSTFIADSSLDPIYGQNPLSAQVYIRVSPGIMRMSMQGRQIKNMNDNDKDHPNHRH